MYLFYISLFFSIIQIVPWTFNGEQYKRNGLCLFVWDIFQNIILIGICYMTEQCIIEWKDKVVFNAFCIETFLMTYSWILKHCFFPVYCSHTWPFLLPCLLYIFLSLSLDPVRNATESNLLYTVQIFIIT